MVPTWKWQNWPFWGQATWRDLWAIGQEKDVRASHVTGHAPLVTPGKDTAEALSMVVAGEGSGP